jgi:hypothetical protein
LVTLPPGTLRGDAQRVPGRGCGPVSPRQALEPGSALARASKQQHTFLKSPTPLLQLLDADADASGDGPSELSAGRGVS